MPPEDIRTTLETLDKSGLASSLPFAVKIFELFDGKGGREDLRAQALIAVRGTHSRTAVPFLLKVAESEKGNIVGDWALEALDWCGGPSEIPTVLALLQNPETCVEAQITAVNVLANYVQQLNWKKHRLDHMPRSELSAAALAALSHEHPKMRAFGCRLAAQLDCHLDVLKRLAKEDHVIYFGGKSVAEEAEELLEKSGGPPTQAQK